MAETGERAFYDDGLTETERGSAAVNAQKLVCQLPSEAYRRDKDLQNIRLYEHNPVITLYSFAGNYYSDAVTLALPPPEQSVNNKAKAAIDTLAAQIASTNQRARFTVVDGNYKQRGRSRKLQNFSDGLALELKLHRLKQRAFMDAAILESGVGCIQFYEEDGRCKAQRVLATELSIDPRDGLVDGLPRTLYRRRPVPRATVRATWGGVKGEDAARIEKAITDAPKVSAGGAPGDYVEVFECWHLPTSKKAKDGYHIVGLDVADGVLEVTEYTKPYHEIVFFSLEERFTTGWGLSLMTQMRPLQLRINANDYRITRAQKLFHAGHVYVPKEMQLKKEFVNNEIGSVWMGNGPTPPQQVLFSAVTAEMYQQIERDGQRIFENNGISQAASQGETNAGLNASAAAKREDTAKSDKRNAVRQQRWEQLHLDCIRVALGIVRDIVTRGEKSKPSGYKVAVPGRRGLSVVDWRESAIDEEDYVLETKPASPIPTDPAGLVAYGDHMLEIGEWKPGDLTGYLQDLDADGRTNRKKSQERNLEKVFEALLYEPRAAAMPDEFTNYQVALEIGTEYLAQGEEDGVPQKNLAKVRTYLKRCKAKAAASAPPAPQPQPQQAAPPPG